MRLIVIHSFVHDASMLIASRNIFIIISLPRSKEDNPWIRVAGTRIAETSHRGKNLRQNSRPEILLPGSRLNSSPFFCFTIDARVALFAGLADLSQVSLGQVVVGVFTKGKIGFSTSSQEVLLAPCSFDGNVIRSFFISPRSISSLIHCIGMKKTHCRSRSSRRIAPRNVKENLVSAEIYVKTLGIQSLTDVSRVKLLTAGKMLIIINY